MPFSLNIFITSILPLLLVTEVKIKRTFYLISEEMVQTELYPMTAYFNFIEYLLNIW